MIVIRDEFYNAEQEVEALKQLLKKAKKRQRSLLKDAKRQSWLDWLMEMIGL